jgi:hypothetical protein
MELINWRFEIRKLEDIKPWSRNPRRITKNGMEDLTKSIKRFGLPEPIVLNMDNTIIGGHARYQVLKKEGAADAVCAIPDRMLDEKELEELNIRLNKNVAGDFDYDLLANEFNTEELLGWGFDEKELLGHNIPNPKTPEFDIIDKSIITITFPKELFDLIFDNVNKIKDLKDVEINVSR